MPETQRVESCYHCGLDIIQLPDLVSWTHADITLYTEWLASLPHPNGKHNARYEPLCILCGRDNANGTHRALEGSHLNHPFTPPKSRWDFPNSWVQTYSGVQFWPLDPHIDEINFTDIAHALARICRYGGHTTTFYSVAEHCLIMSHHVSRENRLAALLHDAAEAYVGDMVRPLKSMMPDYKAVEVRLMDLIAAKVGLETLYPDEVKEADNRIILDEREMVMSEPPAEWVQDKEGIKPLGVEIKALPYYQASYAWLERFNYLTTACSEHPDQFGGCPLMHTTTEEMIGDE